ncbi:MAG: hypothetical protein ACYCV6_02580 [Steroidobacteraceae bacterium]
MTPHEQALEWVAQVLPTLPAKFGGIVDADDLRQQTYLLALEMAMGLTDFNPKLGSARAYLATQVYWCARRASRLSAINSSDDIDGPEMSWISLTAGVEEMLIDQEDRAAREAVLQTLDSSRQQTFVCLTTFEIICLHFAERFCAALVGASRKVARTAKKHSARKISARGRTAGAGDAAASVAAPNHSRAVHGPRGRADASALRRSRPAQTPGAQK